MHFHAHFKSHIHKHIVVTEFVIRKRQFSITGEQIQIYTDVGHLLSTTWKTKQSTQTDPFMLKLWILLHFAYIERQRILEQYYWFSVERFSHTKHTHFLLNNTLLCSNRNEFPCLDGSIIIPLAWPFFLSLSHKKTTQKLKRWKRTLKEKSRRKSAIRSTLSGWISSLLAIQSIDL